MRRIILSNALGLGLALLVVDAGARAAEATIPPLAPPAVTPRAAAPAAAAADAARRARAQNEQNARAARAIQNDPVFKGTRNNPMLGDQVSEALQKLPNFFPNCEHPAPRWCGEPHLPGPWYHPGTIHVRFVHRAGHRSHRISL
jgi:hypothetical protein